jgi:hypothetical protein
MQIGKVKLEIIDVIQTLWLHVKSTADPTVDVDSLPANALGPSALHLVDLSGIAGVKLNKIGPTPDCFCIGSLSTKLSTITF